MDVSSWQQRLPYVIYKNETLNFTHYNFTKGAIYIFSPVGNFGEDSIQF